MINTIDLFPSRVYKSRIDPLLWNKDQFVRESIQSYNIDPHRHAENMPDSEFHTTFLDDENKKFNTINKELLKDVYTKVISNFFELLKLNRCIEYNWQIINISVGKDNWYDWHYHGGIPNKDNLHNDYVMVHYINFDGLVHGPTVFRNPLIIATYPHNLLQRHILDGSYYENSTYHSSYQLNINEDDVIIFPSYLFHSVQKKNSNTDKFRIITSTHIDIKYSEKEIYGY